MNLARLLRLCQNPPANLMQVRAHVSTQKEDRMTSEGWRSAARWVMAAYCVLATWGAVPSPLFAETTAPAVTQAPPTPAAGAPVKFENVVLFTVYETIGSFTPQERAKAIEDRLIRISRDPQIPLDEIGISDIEHTTVLMAGDTVIMALTDRDVAPLGQERQAVATDYATKIRAALAKSREQVTLRALLIDAALALLDTAILVILLVLIHKIFPKVYSKIDGWRGTVIRPIRIQRVELFSADQIAGGLVRFAKGIRVAAVLLLLYTYLTTVLGIHPWTRGISASLLDAVVSTLRTIGQAFAAFIPDVISIAIIIVVTRYIIKLIALFFTSIERGAIMFPGFYREWAQPTYKIVRLMVIMFAAIAVFPYIPGSRSEGFRGISVFLGLLLSLASAAAIGNLIAGVILTYMRPFRIGDRVRIADTTGDVIEKTLLVTRVRTIKNVDVTIPNAMVLGSHLINFSSCAQDQGLILHTSVTIGYNAPWRTVHELLIAAAKATTHIVAKPEPFVLQTSLNDFYVTYEINAYTDQPNLMADIYAELHQNIQDKFNEAGVEIMSPHYAQIRDGNKTTIPDQYLPKHYQAPGLRIWPLGQLQPNPESPPSSKGSGSP
jgi:small-conductance mechanosensitive channel